MTTTLLSEPDLGADEVPGEDLPRSARFLGRDDGCELPAANVSDELPGGRVQPADDPVGVDDIGGHADPLDGVFDFGPPMAPRSDIAPSSLLLVRLGRNFRECLKAADNQDGKVLSGPD